ncbi:MAG TPA: hypothetical protein VHS96_00915 [Bacteroidia bacterium]|nr:hypothetical protein [Bacteroidia bacterium]
MKSQKDHFPKFLAALPQIDHFQPGDDPADGGGAPAASPFDVTDFQLISSSHAHPGMIFDYTELHLDSVGSGGTTPIKHEDDPQRVMFISGLPGVDDVWEMSVVLTDGDFTDTLNMRRVAGSFSQMQLDFGDMVIFREDGVFFTVKLGEKQFETYVNTNMEAEVARLRHTSETTFDRFGVSLLGRSN